MTFPPHAAAPLLASLAVAALAGCSSMEEGTEAENPRSPAPPPSSTARLEYRIDSLLSENRILRQQIDALAAENRSLTARAADLESHRAGSAPRPPKAPPAAGATVPPAPPAKAASPKAAPAKPAGAAGTYEEALAEYRARRFQEAAGQFEALLARGAGKDLEDNCWYWFGECRFAQGRHAEAATAFGKVFAYEGSEKGPDARYMLGSSWAALGDSVRARKEYARVVADYPGSPQARRAKEKLGRP